MLGCARGLWLGCARGRGCRDHDWRRHPEPVGSTTCGAVRHGNKEAQKRLGGASDERLDPKWLRT